MDMCITANCCMWYVGMWAGTGGRVLGTMDQVLRLLRNMKYEVVLYYFIEV